MKTLSMTDLVKDNLANFLYFRDGSMFYSIVNPQGKKVAVFPIDITSKDETGNAAFEASHKAITLMRYIRKALKDETLFVL